MMARPPAYGASGFGFEPHGIKRPQIILLEMVTSWRPPKKRPWVLIPGGILDCLTFNTPIVLSTHLKLPSLHFQSPVMAALTKLSILVTQALVDG